MWLWSQGISVSNMKWLRNIRPLISQNLPWTRDSCDSCAHQSLRYADTMQTVLFLCSLYLSYFIFYAQWLRYCLWLHIFSLILFEVDHFKTGFQHLNFIEYYLSTKLFFDNRPNSEPFMYLVIWNMQTLSEILNFSVDVVRGEVFLLHGAPWEEVVMC